MTYYCVTTLCLGLEIQRWLRHVSYPRKVYTVPEEPDTMKMIRLSVHKPYEYGTQQRWHKKGENVSWGQNVLWTSCSCHSLTAYPISTPHLSTVPLFLNGNFLCFLRSWLSTSANLVITRVNSGTENRLRQSSKSEFQELHLEFCQL